MFSSNQILKVSGTLDDTSELEAALGFALKYSGDLECFTRPKNPANVLWQISKYGDFCIGWYPEKDGIPEGWNLYPFAFDLQAICHTIRRHLLDYKDGDYPIARCNFSDIVSGDGTAAKGFLMRELQGGESELQGIQNPFCGIVAFSPFECYYAK